MESLIKSVGENDYQPEKCMYLQYSTNNLQSSFKIYL